MVVMVTVVTVVVADQVSQFGDQMRRAKPLMNTGPNQVEGQYCLSTAKKVEKESKINKVL